MPDSATRFAARWPDFATSNASAAAEHLWLGLASAAAEMLVVVVGMPVAVEALAAGAVVGAVAVAS